MRLSSSSRCGIPMRDDGQWCVEMQRYRLPPISDNHSHLWPGVPFALGSAILFGASAPLSKLLIGSIDPWLLAGILYLEAGAGFAIVHWGRPIIGLPNQEAPLQKADLPWLMAVILFGG